MMIIRDGDMMVGDGKQNHEGMTPTITILCNYNPITLPPSLQFPNLQTIPGPK